MTLSQSLCVLLALFCLMATQQHVNAKQCIQTKESGEEVSAECTGKRIDNEFCHALGSKRSGLERGCASHTRAHVYCAEIGEACRVYTGAKEKVCCCKGPDCNAKGFEKKLERLENAVEVTNLNPPAPVIGKDIEEDGENGDDQKISSSTEAQEELTEWHYQVKMSDEFEQCPKTDGQAQFECLKNLVQGKIDNKVSQQEKDGTILWLENAIQSNKMDGPLKDAYQKLIYDLKGVPDNERQSGVNGDKDNGTGDADKTGGADKNGPGAVCGGWLLLGMSWLLIGQNQ